MLNIDSASPRCIGNSARFLLLLFAALVTSYSATAATRCCEPVGQPIASQPTRDDPEPFLNAEVGNKLVGLAVSGGGSRAAYFSAAVLREAHRSHLHVRAETSLATEPDLLGQFDLVSAVSGGSMSAAYFVANIDQLKVANPDSEAWDSYMEKMAADYRKREWYVQGILNPASWFRSLFTKFNRGSIARNDYDGRRLFNGATIASLPNRPVLYLNALDVGNGVRFIFSRHYIDTLYYEGKSVGNQLGEPHQITSNNDLVNTQVTPASISLADAVYASSAFPFAYPNLALNNFGRNKITYQGNLVFLADGGLVDNSGLLTLLTQARIEFERSRDCHAVLVIYIDSSVDTFKEGTIFERQGIEAQYAWKDTYLGHGRASIGAAISAHEDTIVKFLDGTGVVTDAETISYEHDLTRFPDGPETHGLVSWLPPYQSGRLHLRPLVISLRLRDIARAYYALFASWNQPGGKIDPRLEELFAAAGIPSGSDPASLNGWPATTFRELENRLSAVKTDFTLGSKDRAVLDLAAYIEVHGTLEPALDEWNRIASQSDH